jgi:hypothetical protein
MNKTILGKAVRRAVELSERVGDRLKEFVSTEEVPYSYGLGGGSDMKPNFPSLYLSRSTDASLMKMPGEGSAMVKYRIKRREIDESREDGQPLYGASIEIQSLDPVADEETGLESTVFLKEFGDIAAARYTLQRSKELRKSMAHLTKLPPDRMNTAPRKKFLAKAKGFETSVFLKEFGMNPRSVTKLMKTSKRNPLVIRKNRNVGEYAVTQRKAAQGAPNTYYTDDIKDARNTAAFLLKRKRAGQDVGFQSQTPASRYFAEARDRDGEGRFASGNIPGPQDYAIAAMAAKQKKKPAGMVLPKGAAKPMGMR